ncbi:hypothetical protein ACH5RR_039381 [Cinchona calisaya]|uniref:Uncharacterized protein n=1 Tax=Cinchona calisaya TaxID=153742 RepID=A0ABD2XZG6_9GENT
MPTISQLPTKNQELSKDNSNLESQFVAIQKDLENKVFELSAGNLGINANFVGENSNLNGNKEDMVLNPKEKVVSMEEDLVEQLEEDEDAKDLDPLES